MSDEFLGAGGQGKPIFVTEPFVFRRENLNPSQKGLFENRKGSNLNNVGIIGRGDTGSRMFAKFQSDLLGLVVRALPAFVEGHLLDNGEEYVVGDNAPSGGNCKWIRKLGRQSNSIWSEKSAVIAPATDIPKYVGLFESASCRCDAK